jgi:Cu2+-exporting ATPase
MTISTISVSDMHCSACASKVRRALAPVAGISATFINPVRRQVLVEHGSETDPLDIMERIEAAGFTPALAGLDDHDARQRALLKRLGIAGLAAMQVMMASIALYAGAFDGMAEGYERLLEHTSLLFSIPVVCYSAVPFFSSALVSLRAGRLDMDVPIALAIGIAFSVSLSNTLTGTGEVYFDSVVMFSFLLLGARYIDNRLQRRFDLSGRLLSALPQQAIREAAGGGRETVETSALEVGNRIWVDEGARVPVDGLLESTTATLDEAMLTGESDWVVRHKAGQVFAGTINRGAGFAMQATHTFDRSRIADIAQLADQAEVANARITRLTDRIAGIFVPAVLGLAALTFITWHLIDPSRALIAALTVLVVSCPCALSLATPAALTAAMTRLRQLGVVLTNSAALERAADLDTIFIDKTGTLTMQQPAIERVEVLVPGYAEADCLALAAALQRHSSHPYARAFARDDATAALPLEAIAVTAGQGVSGRLDGCEVRIGSASFAGRDEDDRWVYLTIGGTAAARFALSNRIRPDAPRAVRALQVLGAAPIMHSGDSAQRCREVAQSLGIDYLARQSPEAKLEAIRAAQADGHRVLMLGDGINDIPVLAGADVSAAVVEASDLVKSKADVLLLSSRLGPIADLISIAMATRRVIRQNLLWALLYNLGAIPIAALGLMPPWLAALGMAGSSTLVMLNAIRLLAMDPGTQGLEA